MVDSMKTFAVSTQHLWNLTQPAEELKGIISEEEWSCAMRIVLDPIIKSCLKTWEANVDAAIPNGMGLCDATKAKSSAFAMLSVQDADPGFCQWFYFNYVDLAAKDGNDLPPIINNKKQIEIFGTSVAACLLQGPYVKVANTEFAKFGVKVTVKLVPFEWDTDNEGYMMYQDLYAWEFSKLVTEV